MFIEHLIEQERAAEEMRRRIYEQELQKEQEAKQRMRHDLMEALVKLLIHQMVFFCLFSLFCLSLIQMEMLIRY